MKSAFKTLTAAFAVSLSMLAPAAALEIGKAATPEALAPSETTDMIIGAKDAPVVIVEYMSMTCSHCADFSKNSFPALKKEYIDTGKVRFVLREFPLDIKAAAAAVVARCIAGKDSGVFFSAVEEMLAAQEKWIMKDTAGELQKIAAGKGMDQKTFEDCFQRKEILETMQKGQNIATEQLKVASTPTFFVNGTMIRGNSYPELEKAIKDASSAK